MSKKNSGKDGSAPPPLLQKNWPVGYIRLWSYSYAVRSPIGHLSNSYTLLFMIDFNVRTYLNSALGIRFLLDPSLCSFYRYPTSLYKWAYNVIAAYPLSIPGHRICIKERIWQKRYLDINFVWGPILKNHDAVWKLDYWVRYFNRSEKRQGFNCWDVKRIIRNGMRFLQNQTWSADKRTKNCHK